MISVIVPVYNSASQLPRCIESILGQTYRDFELLLMDDGSSDNSLEICRTYEARDSRVRVYTHDNQGVSATRNWGLSIAKGKYVEFVDSDDFLRENTLETLRTAIEAENADLAMCGLAEIGHQGETLNLPRIQKTVELCDLEREYPEIFERYLLNSPCNKLYKRELIQKGFPEDLSMGEDLLFNLEYLHGCRRMAFVKEALYIYECLDTGLVQRRRSDAIEIAERLYLASMNFKEEIHLGPLAQQHISAIFLKFLFHGISQLYSTPEMSRNEKKALLKKWAVNPHVKAALVAARMPETKQRVAQFLLKHRCVTAMHLMMCVLADAKR